MDDRGNKMKDFYKIYSKDIPEFLLEFASTKEMQRLKGVGMNCGCEYTSFSIFKSGTQYSRYIHSLGVALIVWNFTKDKAKSVAGLLHDISTPVFAHTIDFLNNDHEKQESTEAETKRTIEESNEIMYLLNKYSLNLNEVADYHIYPVADNDSPKLSADRLEYSLGNMYNYGFCSMKEIIKYYNNLVVGKNEYDETELMFKDVSVAVEFTKNVLKNSRVYFGDEDRFAMQKLADLLKVAIGTKVLNKEDLYKTEDTVISKLISIENTKALWNEFNEYSTVKTSVEKPTDTSWIKVSSKKRFIDPFVKDRGRVSKLSKGVLKEIEEIKSLTFDYWIGSE